MTQIPDCPIIRSIERTGYPPYMGEEGEAEDGEER